MDISPSRRPVMVDVVAAAAIIGTSVENVLAGVEEGSVRAVLDVGSTERELRFHVGELFLLREMVTVRRGEWHGDLEQAICGGDHGAWVPAARVYASLGISHTQMMRMIRTGEFAGSRTPAGRWNVSRESVRKFIGRRKP
jgi:hypothetical protein